MNSPEYHSIMMNVSKLEKELSERGKKRIESQAVKSKEDENYRLPMPLSVGYLGLKTQKEVPAGLQRKINHTIQQQKDVPEVLNEPESLYEDSLYFQGNEEQNGATALDIDYEYFPSNNDDYYDEPY